MIVGVAVEEDVDAEVVDVSIEEDKSPTVGLEIGVASSEPIETVGLTKGVETKA